VSNLQHYINTSIDPNFGQFTFQNEMIITPFWKPNFCSWIIQKCKNVSSNLYSIDPEYKTQEISLDKLDLPLFEDYMLHYKNEILPLVRKFWTIHDPDISMSKSPYIVKYGGNDDDSVAKNINTHCDSSLFTVYWKLNNDYDGGVLYFPRQKWDNRNVPVGHAIIWPSKLTHPHYTDNITRGEKYSVVSFN
jgi:hypothetical protein